MEENTTATEQFITDYELVTDNNYEAYTAIQTLLGQEGSHRISWLSDHLKESFENRIMEVVERERRRGNEYTADLIAQMLVGWGSSAFDEIARIYIDAHLADSLHNHFSNTLKEANA
jgi:hypothetical protein